MRLCYGLLLSSKKMQALRLIETLLVEDNQIVLHVDAKNDDLYETLCSLYKDHPQVFFVDRRIDCKWGHISLIEGMVELLKKAEPLTFDYYTLMSESCLPLKSDADIKSYLEMHYPTEFIECFVKPSCRSRLHLYHREMTEKHRIHRNWIAFKEIVTDFFIGGLIGNKDFRSWKVYHGTQWSTITHAFVSFAVRYIEEKKIIEKYRYVMFGDEHFMQEVFVQSPYYKNRNQAMRKRGNALIYINWKVVSAPKTLTMADRIHFEKEPYLYARKFDVNVDQEVIEYLYQKRKGEKSCEK